MKERSKNIQNFTNYSEISDLTDSDNSAVKESVWDPSEPVSTRPLAISIANVGTYFYTYDLTKNVCELIDTNLEIAQTYDYAPFGAVEIGIPSGGSAIANPFQFSSEVYDSELALNYYNYRHYNPADGRWLSRDPIAEQGGWNLYAFLRNNIFYIDKLGTVIALVTNEYTSVKLYPKPSWDKSLNNCQAYSKINVKSGIPKIRIKKKSGFFSSDIYELYVEGGSFNVITYHDRNEFFSHPDFLKIPPTKLYLHEKRHYDDWKKLYNEYANFINAYDGKKICGNHCLNEYKKYNVAEYNLLTPKMDLSNEKFHQISGNYYDSEQDKKKIKENIKQLEIKINNLKSNADAAKKALDECILKYGVK